MSQLSQIIQDLAQEWGISPPLADASGRYQLVLNEQLVLQFEASVHPGSFFVYGMVGQVPTACLEAISLLALSENLFGKGTGSASLGLHPETRQLCLFEKFEAGALHQSVLTERLSSFAGYLHYWQERLEQELNSRTL